MTRFRVQVALAPAPGAAAKAMVPEGRAAGLRDQVAAILDTLTGV